MSAPPLLESAQRALATSHFTLGDWPKATWWENFEQDELNLLIERALRDNPTLQAIRERMELARQEAIVVRSKLYPLLTFDASDQVGQVSKYGLIHKLNPSLPRRTSIIDLALNFTFELDIWGKNTNLFHAALDRTKAELAECSQVALVITTAMAEAYYALKTNLYRLRLYEALAAVRQQTYDLQMHLQRHALLSKLPPSLALEEVEETKKQIAIVTEEIALGFHLLNVLSGAGPDEPLNIDESLPALSKSMTLPSNLSLDLLSRRPDIMAAIWRAEAHAHQVGAAIADFYPSLNLAALVGLNSVGYNTIFTPASVEAQITPAIHLPIFTAGAIRANVNANKAAFYQAVFDYNQLLLTSAKEVADRLSILSSVYERESYQKIILDEAVFRCNLTKLNVESGLDNNLQLYAIEEEWINKALENTSLIFDQYAASIQLIKALGGGYHVENLPKLVNDP